MKSVLRSGAIALGLILVSSAALADDPNDPLLSRSSAARARDKETIRQLNLAEFRKVQARDARLAKQWREWREYQQQQGHGRDN